MVSLKTEFTSAKKGNRNFGFKGEFETSEAIYVHLHLLEEKLRIYMFAFLTIRKCLSKSKIAS